MFNILSRFIVPHCCILCHASTINNYDLCSACETELPYLKQTCQKCALPLQDVEIMTLCAHCQRRPPPFQSCYSLFHYQAPIVQLITLFKFHCKLNYGYVLSQLLAKHLSQHYQHHTLPEVIIPIPLHTKRLRERGFNQSLELARPIARQLQLPVNINACQRIRATEKQSVLPAKSRLKNVRKAFLISKTISASHVAVIDDIMTTGATMRELCQTLSDAGIEKIDVWCVARATSSL